jgi:hypothetical protein
MQPLLQGEILADIASAHHEKLILLNLYQNNIYKTTLSGDCQLFQNGLLKTGKVNNSIICRVCEIFVRSLILWEYLSLEERRGRTILLFNTMHKY